MRHDTPPRPFLPAETMAYALALAALLVIVAIPLVRVHHPPLQDYANHLARMFVLAHLDAPAIRDFWQSNWTPIPNLAMDVIVPLLGRWLPLATAGKLFVFVTQLSLFTGACALHYALYRRLSFVPLFAVLLLPNLALQKGFLNYSFAIGLLLWLYAGWIWVSRGPVSIRVLYNLFTAPLVYFSHVHGFAVYAITVGMNELAGGWRRDVPKGWKIGIARAAIASIGFIPILIVHLTANTAITDGSERWMYARWEDKLPVSRFILPLFDKVSDTVLSSVMVGAAGIALWRGWLTFPRPVAAVMATLLAIYAALPFEAFTGSNVDWRTLIPFSFLFVAGASLAWEPKLNTAAGATILLFVVGLATLRYSNVNMMWSAADKNYVEFTRVVRNLPQGAKLFSAVVNMPYDEAIYTRSVYHLPSYAVIERSAFVPSLFTFEAQQPLRVKDALKPLVNRETRDSYYGYERRIDCALVGSGFEYALLISGKELDASATCGWIPVYKAQTMTLFRVQAP